MELVYIIIIVAAVIFLLVIFLLLLSKGLDVYDFDDQHIRRAGKCGEKIAENVILRLMNDGDHLLSNVEVSYNYKTTELDEVIINRYGIFIIEVKNFSGIIYGSEDDDEWEKYKITNAGNTYPKNIRNPLKQVNRQVWILKNFLYSKGIDVWVDGYVYMINGNSPFESDFLLNNADDIDYAIHGFNKPVLCEKQIYKILKLLDDNNQQ